MSPDPQLLRAESFQDIGQVIQRDAALLVENWCQRALQEQAEASRVHHHVLRDELPQFLRAMGKALEESHIEDSCQFHFLAVAHGEQRWEAGWSLAEVVQDYQIMRLVLLEHLEHSLDRPLGSREVMAIGLALDEAITASVGMYTNFRDEYTRVQEQQRNEDLRRWAQIFDHAGWGVGLLDPTSFELTSVNPMFANLHGRPADELVGHSWLDFVAEPVRETVREHLQRALAADHEQFESHELRPNADPLPVLATVTAIRDTLSTVQHLAVNIQDISQRKQLEESLRAQTELLAQTDRRKDEFLATLAHELRNPLAPILNALEILRLPNVTPAATSESIDIADRQVRQVVRLVDDLLDVTRISQGKVALRKQPVDVAHAVACAVESSRPILDGNRHQLELELPEQPLVVEVDPARLEQVLTNLLNNAAKYTEPGGQIRLSAALEGEQVVIRVRDNGIGIEPALLPRIFELFVQSDHTELRARGGLGIGLALVQRLVRLHGGSIEAASAGLGHGSEFTVRLPVHRPAAAATPAGKAKPGPGAASTKILLVDDNKDVVNMLAMLLRRVGHEVSVAHDGDSALEVAATERPAVVLLDIGLPGRNGYQVAAALRERPEFAQTCLVAMTGYGQDDDVRQAREAGFDHHLLKPVRLESIQEIVTRFTARP